MKRVLLKDVVKAMNAIYGDIVVLFDKKTYHFLYIPKQYQEQVHLYLQQDHVIAFINFEDIDFVGIREQFIETLSGNMRVAFEKGFVGQYRFKKFKDLLSQYHQWEEFKSFENDKYSLIARIWCEKNQIHYA